MRSHRNAFTLVEILVSIALLGLLTAILFPTFLLSRRQAQKTQCLSHLKQIGQAISAYAADYNDTLPYAPSSITRAKLQSGRAQYGPPLDDRARGLPDVWALLHAYGINAAITSCPNDRLSPILASESGKATWTEYVGSSYDYDDETALSVKTLASYANPAQSLLSKDYEGFHNSFCNGLFADFHLQRVTRADYVAPVAQ